VTRLRRSSPSDPGWTRRRAGSGFIYLDETGARLDEEAAQRCRELVIPPAWKNVWICPAPNGHLQAVGTDDAGRKQYLYHPDWRTKRDGEKHVRVIGFAKVLSRAREQILQDLGTSGMSQDRACATAVRLLDLGYFRIGNDVYAEENNSFGLTTLQKRHVRKVGGRVVFQFEGKSGIEHRIEIDDPATISALDVMRKRRAPADAELLAWKEGRSWRDLDSGHVNDYLRRTTGVDSTAKDFRTWHATVLAAIALAESDEPGETVASQKRAISAAMKEVSSYLGNTPALARASYVDPRVIDAYQEGKTILGTARRKYHTADEKQAACERAVLRLLR
jgi:DNA topoisomerase IB